MRLDSEDGLLMSGCSLHLFNIRGARGHDILHMNRAVLKVCVCVNSAGFLMMIEYSFFLFVL